MSDRQEEQQEVQHEGAAPATPGAAPATAGAWLREARQQRGLHIAAVAALLKVPQAKLEALEADRWQDLTDMTFVRALAKAVCRTLKVDPEPVLELLPRTVEPELNVSRGINKPFRERAMHDEGVSLALLQRPLVWGPALLLIAAVAVYLLPNRLLEPSAAPEATAPAASDPALAAAPASEAALEALAQAPVEAAASAAPVAAVPPAAVASTPASAAPRVAVAASAPTGASGVAVPIGDALPLRLQLSADSWISVTDARGQVLLSRLVKPGDEPELVGQTPLKVTVGNVAGTALSWRGTPFDLAARNVNNVARFELN